MSATLLLAAIALAAAQAGSGNLPSMASPQANSNVQPRLLRVYATPDGESHIEEIRVAPTAGPLRLETMRAISYQPAKVEWHVAPRRQFAINLTGEIEAETSDGTKQRIGPGDLVFLEDTTGKGHITRLLTPVTALFIVPDQSFDVRAWAAGVAGD
jgi:quercetin dioxygenase-like cupin family protein